MKLLQSLIASGLLISAAVSSNAVPTRYEINHQFAVGQFTIDIPNRDATPPLEEIHATDFDGVIFPASNASPWVDVRFLRSDGAAALVFSGANGVNLGLGSGSAGLGFIEGWNAIVSGLGLVEVPLTSVPDGGATAAMLGLGVGGLALIRRRMLA